MLSNSALNYTIGFTFAHEVGIIVTR